MGVAMCMKTMFKLTIASLTHKSLLAEMLRLEL